MILPRPDLSLVWWLRMSTPTCCDLLNLSFYDQLCSSVISILLDITMGYIYIVERHNYEHHTDDIGRKHFLSAHTSLKLANRKAKVYLYRFLREEDQNSCGEIESEDIEKDGTYSGMVALRQDYSREGIDYTVVKVIKEPLRDKSWDHFSDDEEEEEEFKEAAGGFSSDEEEVIEIIDSDDSDGNENNQPRPQTLPGKHARTSSASSATEGLKKKAKLRK